MHINSNTVLVGQTILLVPYKKHHVKKYHTWMENEEILELTASSPLSIDEEYEMQQTWLDDKDKCTFIVLSKEIFDRTHDEIESMIGDVNLSINNPNDIHCGEVGIMIAEVTARHKGYGIETLNIFIRYAIETLNITRFIVSIGLKNLPSINLFTKKFHFLTIQTTDVFQEITMERQVDNEFIEMIHSKTPNYKIDFYDNLITNKKV
ncbi:unnamed protein product [Rotaria sp. Silwood2]|nr:unnamed protein product [Rotaria sp. Silwood2]CAF3297517.1 unnamed protein product [Rotaria sp. Silwood2]CAF4334126.1 unnamed protein product [Rotaria sp. Silwood2]CAF4412274.1 unnamed protein product [Rotaria sp. Silwood2]